MFIISLSALAIGILTLYILAHTQVKAGIYQPIKNGAIQPPSFLVGKTLLQVIWEGYIRPFFVAMGIWMVLTWVWAIVGWFV